VKNILLIAVVILASCASPLGRGRAPVSQVGGDQALQLSRQSLIDKLEGGWVGQMVGVSWGAPTEFTCLGKTVEAVPAWESWKINQAFAQDDLYVELPFMAAMREHGVNASWSDFGEHFKATRFMLWHANAQGRDNLRQGIAAPDSGHYTDNPHADDIDWQIEADFAGLITPGQPGVAIDIAWRAGHVMNYGDGVYGGVMIAAMHSAAYTAKTVAEIVEAGRQAVPVGSQFRQVIDDVIVWHAINPEDWKATWQMIQDKWGAVDRCPEGINSDFNIDAKLNAAYVILGLLYGQGDFEGSMRIAMQSGQDSDCNTSSVGGILGNYLGLSGVPEKFKEKLDKDKRFSYTVFSYTDVIDLSLDLVAQILAMQGGRIEGTGNDEVWDIPTEGAIQAPILEQWPAQLNQPPEMTISVETSSARTISLKAEADDADGILAYQWFFGDLTYAFGQETSHTYLDPGVYEVIGYVSDQTGNTSWKSVLVEVKE